MSALKIRSESKRGKELHRRDITPLPHAQVLANVP
jgi:hypothetical protein